MYKKIILLTKFLFKFQLFGGLQCGRKFLKNYRDSAQVKLTRRNFTKVSTCSAAGNFLFRTEKTPKRFFTEERQEL